jgi:hypothetical protein
MRIKRMKRMKRKARILPTTVDQTVSCRFGKADPKETVNLRTMRQFCHHAELWDG